MLAAAGASAITASTAQLSLSAAISDVVAAPGHRLSIAIDVTPAPGIHVYAPGKHGYQVVRLTLTPQPWLRVHAPVYPRSEIYHFKPLDERVEVYSRPFRLRTDVTILATPDVQKLLAGRPSVTIAGALEYQACDDKVCFNPARVPISFEVTMKPLDRRPPGGY
jgi:DsbC/DsbD-like thiol-disulfide interchange protein